MYVETRLLALIVELFFVPKIIEDRKARQIFDKISDTHNIKSFTVVPNEGFLMSNNQQHIESINYRILKDRFLAIYEFCDKSMNYYIGLLNDIIGIFKDTTDINLFIVHNITIRKLVDIAGINDTREFLIKNVFSLNDENLRTFERPLHLIGTRIFFPGINQENIDSFDIKIETSMENFKTFFLENKGIFPKPLNIEKDQIELVNSINKTEKFLDKNVIDFLTQFLQK